MNNPHADSLQSLLDAAKKLSKDPTMGAFYPHVYWWDVKGYLQLVQRGAVFYVEDHRLHWKLPDPQD